MKHAHRTTSRGTRSNAPAASTAVQQESAAVDSDREIQIREAAYFRYLARGAEVGREMEDWLQAEAALLKAENLNPSDH